MAIEWVEVLERRMARFDDTVECVISDIEERGAHAASPINLSLPTIVNLVAGWVHLCSANDCDHCSEELRLQDKESAAAAALFEATQRFSVFVGRLLIALGDVGADGEVLPFLPPWASSEYERFLLTWQQDNEVVQKRGSKSDSEDGLAVPGSVAGVGASLPGIMFAGVKEQWMQQLVWNYMSVLIIEFGFRVEPRLAESDDIRELAEAWPEECVHDVLALGLVHGRPGVAMEKRAAALHASQDIFEQYLEDNWEWVLMPEPWHSSH